MKKTLVINLFGSPGSGKSTLAAELFADMKKRGMDVEMAREWVKLWAWEGRKMTLEDQFMIFANQVREETALYNKVGIIITDSPLILSPFYEQEYFGSTHTLSGAHAIMDKAEQNDVFYWNFFVERKHPYNPNGRFQTESQAKLIDLKLKNFLQENGVLLESASSWKDIMLEILI